MLQTIFAAFNNAKDAERAAGALMDHGLTPNDISFIAHESYRQQERDKDEPRAVYSPGEDGPAAGSGVAAIGLTKHVYDAVDIDGQPGEAPEGAVHPNRLGDTVYSGNSPFSQPGSEAAANTLWAPGDDSFDPPVANREEPQGSPRPSISTTTSADAAAGAEKGALAGLGVGLVAGLTSLFLPGVGWVLGGGGLSLALAGTAAATAAGAAAGGVAGYLKDQGIPEDVLTRYRGAFERGGAILGVLPTESVSRPTIEAILAKYGALNIDTYGEERLAG